MCNIHNSYLLIYLIYKTLLVTHCVDSVIPKQAVTYRWETKIARKNIEAGCLGSIPKCSA